MRVCCEISSTNMCALRLSGYVSLAQQISFFLPRTTTTLSLDPLLSIDKPQHTRQQSLFTNCQDTLSKNFYQLITKNNNCSIMCRVKY